MDTTLTTGVLMSETAVPDVPDTEFHLTIQCAPASDGWGFVGRVMIADHECYRTLRAYTAPSDALRATQVLVGDALGALLAGQEWRSLGQDVGRAPTRQDLRFGLSAGSRAVGQIRPARP
ncbi:MAG TPA: hypothetical protein VFT70_06560 [Nocardioides sp.]|nr:hypothetical protein [Nocardioides sp.]